MNFANIYSRNCDQIVHKTPCFIVLTYNNLIMQYSNANIRVETENYIISRVISNIKVCTRGKKQLRFLKQINLIMKCKMCSFIFSVYRRHFVSANSQLIKNGNSLNTVKFSCQLRLECEAKDYGMQLFIFIFP